MAGSTLTCACIFQRARCPLRDCYTWGGRCHGDGRNLESESTRGAPTGAQVGRRRRVFPRPAGGMSHRFDPHARIKSFKTGRGAGGGGVAGRARGDGSIIDHASSGRPVRPLLAGVRISTPMANRAPVPRVSKSSLRRRCSYAAYCCSGFLFAQTLAFHCAPLSAARPSRVTRPATKARNSIALVALDKRASVTCKLGVRFVFRAGCHLTTSASPERLPLRRHNKNTTEKPINSGSHYAPLCARHLPSASYTFSWLKLPPLDGDVRLKGNLL